MKTKMAFFNIVGDSSIQNATRALAGNVFFQLRLIEKKTFLKNYITSFFQVCLQ